LNGSLSHSFSSSFFSLLREFFSVGIDKSVRNDIKGLINEELTFPLFFVFFLFFTGKGRPKKGGGIVKKKKREGGLAALRY
jgi:hypothetical protein